MTITIKHNGFHGRTSRTIRVAGKPGDTVELTPSQVRRLRGAACGCSACTCGESMLSACDPESRCGYDPQYIIKIPASGVVEVDGNYPQR
jgi:hypothetical protein